MDNVLDLQQALDPFDQYEAPPEAPEHMVEQNDWLGEFPFVWPPLQSVRAQHASALPGEQSAQSCSVWLSSHNLQRACTKSPVLTCCMAVLICDAPVTSHARIRARTQAVICAPVAAFCHTETVHCCEQFGVDCSSSTGKPPSQWLCACCHGVRRLSLCIYGCLSPYVYVDCYKAPSCEHRLKCWTEVKQI